MVEPAEEIIPEYEGKSAEDLWNEYVSLHEISIKKRINKPKAREKRVKKHRKTLTEIVDKELKEIDFEDLEDVKDKKKYAAKIVAKIIKKGYEKHGQPGIELSEENFDKFLSMAGAGINYEALLKHMANLDSLEYDKLNPDSPFKRLIDYIAISHDKEGYKIQRIQRKLNENTELYLPLTKAASKTIPKVEFHPSATPNDIFDTYTQHLATLHQQYEQATKARTHKKQLKK